MGCFSVCCCSLWETETLWITNNVKLLTELAKLTLLHGPTLKLHLHCNVALSECWSMLLKHQGWKHLSRTVHIALKPGPAEGRNGFRVVCFCLIEEHCKALVLLCACLDNLQKQFRSDENARQPKGCTTCSTLS